MYDRNFINCCYGYQEYIGEHLRTQKCLLDDSLHVYQFWCFYQKVHDFFLDESDLTKHNLQ